MSPEFPQSDISYYLILPAGCSVGETCVLQLWDPVAEDRKLGEIQFTWTLTQGNIGHLSLIDPSLR